MCNICQGNLHIISNRDIHDFIDIYLDPVIVILTFILGYWISTISFNRKTKAKNHKLLEYFKTYLERQNKAIDRQNEEILKHKKKADNLADTGGFDIVLINQPYFILDSINKEDLLEALKTIRLVTPANFIETLDFIEFTKKCYERHSFQHTNFIDQLAALRERWNSTIQDFHNLKAKATDMPIEAIRANSSVLKLNEVYNDWTSDENQRVQTLKMTIDKLVAPLSTYFEEVYRNNPQDSLALAILSRVQRLEMIYNQWESTVKSYSQYLDKLHTELINETDKHKKRNII